MRKQYYFRQSPQGLLAWDVDRLIEEADLSYPIILSATGEVMDGRHRVAKAALANRDTIECVQFEKDPPPDHVGRRPEELPY